jgi:hypothetical protein
MIEREREREREKEKREVSEGMDFTRQQQRVRFPKQIQKQILYLVRFKLGIPPSSSTRRKADRERLESSQVRSTQNKNFTYKRDVPYKFQMLLLYVMS